MSFSVGFDDVLVLNADEDVLGSAAGGSIESQRAALEIPRLVRRKLSDGSSLVCVPPGATEPARRLARAFVHEVRSPLNALAINLELALTYAKSAFEKKENGPKLEVAIGRAAKQVTRVEELLRVFLSLWAPATEVEECDLVEFAQAAYRLGTHLANRCEAELEIVAEGTAPVWVQGRALADALFCLLDESLVKGSHVLLSIRHGPSVTLVVEVNGAEVPSWVITTRALTALGAQVTREDNQLVAVFPSRGDDR